MPLDQAAVLTCLHLGFHNCYDRTQHKSQHREARSLAFSCEVALAWAGGEDKEKQRRERTQTHKTQPQERKRKRERGKVCFLQTEQHNRHLWDSSPRGETPRNSLAFPDSRRLHPIQSAGRRTRRAALGIEPRTSRTLSENHATRPSSRTNVPSSWIL